MLYCETCGNLRIMSGVESEVYERAAPDKCICADYSIHMIYRTLNDYNCKIKIIDWERISLKHNIKEIPMHF